MGFPRCNFWHTKHAEMRFPDHGAVETREPNASEAAPGRTEKCQAEKFGEASLRNEIRLLSLNTEPVSATREPAPQSRMKDIASMNKTVRTAMTIASFLVLAGSPAAVLAQSSHVGSSPDAAAPQAAGADATPGGGGTSFGGYIIDPSASQTSAGVYIGKPVFNARNESIGEVTDLVIDKRHGVVAAVIGVGGFLGLAEKDVAVPNDRITAVRDAQSGGVRLTTTETTDSLKSAPEFSPSGAL